MSKIRNNLSAKLLTLFLILTIGVALVVGSLSISISGNALKAMVASDMTNLTEQTSSTIESSMGNFFSFLEGMATSPDVYDPNLDAVTQKRLFLQIAKNQGFGDIGYAKADGQTLTSNMETYADISQREYFKMALAGNRYSSDPLEDSVRAGVMIMLLAVPVYENGDSSTGNIVGVLYARMDGNFLSDCTKDIKFGKTGYVYMVNKNGTVIAHPDSQKVVGLENIIESFKDDKAYADEISMLNTVLTTDSGFTTYSSNGKDKSVGYATTTDFGWHVIMCADSAELYSGLTQAKTICVITIILAIIAGAVASLLFARRIATPIKKLNEVNSQLSEGNLVVNTTGIKTSGDEIGQMVKSTSIFIEKLKDVITQTKNSSSKIDSISENVSDLMSQSVKAAESVSHSIDGIAQGTIAQSEEVEHAAQEVTNLGTAVDQINDDVSKLIDYTKAADSAENESSKALEELILSNNRTTESIHKIAAQINETNDAANSISEAAELITEIASQTNLLSLNASIEAARAGEAGRGFAVVASEIQHLSEQSNEAASKIQSIIESLVEGSRASMDKMDETLVLVNEQQQKLELTKKGSKIVSENIAQIHDGAVNIESSTSACASVKSAVESIITNLSAVSEENAANTSETNGAMEELNANIITISTYTENLNGIINELDKSISFWNNEEA